MNLKSKISDIIKNGVAEYNQLFNRNCLGNSYGLARSTLALGSLITLIFSSKKTLFDKDIFEYTRSFDLIEDINLFYQLGYNNLHISILISCLILSLVVLGVSPRLTCIPHFLVSLGIYKSVSVGEGGDQITVVLTLLLIPVALMDTRRNHFSKRELGKSNFYKNSISSILMKMVIPLQVSFLYLNAGIEKLYKTEEWRNGTALYYIFKDPLFSSDFLRADSLVYILNHSYILVVMTLSTIALELLLAGILFMPYNRRKWFLFVGAAFHFMIIIFFGLVSFFFAMLSALILYTLRPDQDYNFSFHKFA